MSKKNSKYITAAVFPIQPLDEHYCGDCEWQDRGVGMCHLYRDEIMSETVSRECETCGHESLLEERFCRCPDCIENEYEVRDG